MYRTTSGDFFCNKYSQRRYQTYCKIWRQWDIQVVQKHCQKQPAIHKHYEKFLKIQKKKTTVWGQVDSPESPETPEITEIIENFIKVAKDFTKLSSINKLCLRKISLQKTVRMKLSVVSGFWNMLYGKKRKPGNARNRQKAF